MLEGLFPKDIYKNFPFSETQSNDYRVRARKPFFNQSSPVTLTSDPYDTIGHPTCALANIWLKFHIPSSKGL